MSKRRRSVTKLYPDIFKFKSHLGKNSLTEKIERMTFNEPLSAATISSDLKSVYATTANGNLLFIDLDQLTIIDKMIGIHKAASRGICLSKKNDFLVTGSVDKSLNVIDIKNKQIIQSKADAHANMIITVCLLKNDNLICSTGYDPESKIWSVSQMECLYVINNPDKAQFNFSVCLKDCSHIIYGDFAHNLRIYSFEKNEFVVTLKNHHNSTIQALALSSDDEDLWSGSPDLCLKKYNLKKNKTLLTIANANTAQIWSIAIPSSKAFVASAGWDLRINMFHYNTGEMICSLENVHEGFVQSMSFYSSDNYLLTSSLDTCLCKLKLGSPEILHKSTGIHDLGIMAMDVSDNSKLLVAASMDHSLVVYDLETMKVIHRWEKAATSFMRSIRIASNNKHVIVGSSDKSISIYDLQEMVKIGHIPNAMESNVFTIDIMRNLNCFISGSYDHSIKIWDFNEHFLVKHIEKAHEHFVLCVKFSYDDKFFISSSFDRSIKMWRTSDWECQKQFSDVHTAAINSVDITSDNKFIVSASDDNTVRILNVNKSRVIHIFRGMFSVGVKSIDLSRDNNLIIAGSFDQTAQIFSLRSRQHMYSLLAHEDMIFQAKFTDDMKYILTSSMDKTIIKWNNPFYQDQIRISWFDAISPISDLGVFLLQRLLNSDTEDKLKVINTFPNVFVYPYGWNLFHIIAIFLPKKIYLNACIENKIPFILDLNKKTPLHYLISNKNRELISLNFLLGKFNLLVYSKDSKLEVIKSLKDVFYDLLRLDSAESAYFLRICCQIPPDANAEDIDGFGSVKAKKKNQAFYINKSLKFSDDLLDQLVSQNGNDQYSIRVIPFKWNYDPISDDINKLVVQLKKNRHEDIFKIKIITTLINYLWLQTKRTHYFLMAGYSIWMIILSVNAGLQVVNPTLCILTIAFAAFYSLIETITSIGSAKNYLQWKFREAFNRIVYYFIFGAFVAIYVLGIDNSTTSWLLSFSLLLGYLKWIMFFRVLDNSRKFIRMLIKIVEEMRSFLFIVALVCFGFSFIFFQLAEDNSGYNDNLVIIYGILFSSFDSSTISRSQMFFFVIVTFFLGVVLLNMVVALMTDKYHEVNLKRTYTDNREKLALIREVLAFKRAVRKIRRHLFKQEIGEEVKGYMFFAEKASEEDDLQKLEQHSNVQTSLMKIIDSQSIASKEINEFKDYMERTMQEKFKSLESKVDSLQKNVDQMKGVLAFLNTQVTPRKQHYVSRFENPMLDGDEISINEDFMTKV